MPNKRRQAKKGKGGRGNSRPQGEVARANFKCYLPINTTTNVSNSPLISSGLGSTATRFASMLDLYNLFRIVSFKFRILSNTTEIQAACVASDVIDNPPTSLSAIMENLHSQILPGKFVGELPWVHLPRSLLHGALPWYKSIPGAADSWDEIPGYFYVYTQTASGQIGLEVKFTVAFKDPVPNVMTPELRAKKLQRERERKRQELLSILASPTPGVLCVPSKLPSAILPGFPTPN